MLDNEFAEAFENCTLTNESFRHADHIRLAWIYTRKFGLRRITERRRNTTML